MYTVSTVHVSSLRMQVEKNEKKKKAWISVGLKLSGVFHGWLDHWTRLPNYRFDASCSQNSESGELPVAANVPRSTHRSAPSFESTRHQSDSWESCPVIEPSVEHSRKLKTSANLGKCKSWTLDWTVD